MRLKNIKSQKMGLLSPGASMMGSGMDDDDDDMMDDMPHMIKMKLSIPMMKKIMPSMKGRMSGKIKKKRLPKLL